MSDDKVRLWRIYGGSVFYTDAVPFDEGRPREWYIARPVADDDAREERLKELDRKWNAAVYDADKVRGERDRAERERDTYRDTAHAMMGAVFGEEPPWTDEKIDRMEASTVGAGDKKPSDTIRRIVRDRDEWRARAERAEAVISDALAIDKGERMERPQPHHPLLSVMAGNRASLAEFAAWARKAEAERDSARAVAQRLGRVLAELTNPYASPIIYTQPPTPDEYDTDTVHSYAMGARAGQYLALCIVKSAVARIDAEAGGGKDGPTNDRNHDAAAASGAAGTDPKEP